MLLQLETLNFNQWFLALVAASKSQYYLLANYDRTLFTLYTAEQVYFIILHKIYCIAELAARLRYVRKGAAPGAVGWPEGPISRSFSVAIVSSQLAGF